MFQVVIYNQQFQQTISLMFFDLQGNGSNDSFLKLST